MFQVRIEWFAGTLVANSENIDSTYQGESLVPRRVVARIAERFPRENEASA